MKINHRLDHCHIDMMQSITHEHDSPTPSPSPCRCWSEGFLRIVLVIIANSSTQCSWDAFVVAEEAAGIAKDAANRWQGGLPQMCHLRTWAHGMSVCAACCCTSVHAGHDPACLWRQQGSLCESALFVYCLSMHGSPIVKVAMLCLQPMVPWSCVLWYAHFSAIRKIAVAFKHCLADHVFKSGRCLLPCAKLSCVSYVCFRQYWGSAWLVQEAIWWHGWAIGGLF